MIDPLLDHTIRHAVDLTQYSNGVLARMIRILNLTDADLIGQLHAALADEDPETFKVQRLEGLLASVRDLNHQAYAAFYGGLQTELKAYVGYEGQFQYDLYKSLVPVSFKIAEVVPEQVYAAAMSQPMQGRLLKDWSNGLRDSRMRRIKDTIAIGFTQGQTTADIVRALRGTKGAGYADGLLNTDRHNIDSIVRTAISHTAQTTRNRFYDENASILGDLIWVSTLDGRTSEDCRARDQRRYTQAHKPVEHEVPWLAGPGRLHFSCRSTSIALLRGQTSLTGTRSSADGYVNANLSYDDWLKQQPASVQDDVLGKAKGERYRKDGMSAGAFQNDKGQSITLKEMQARDERAFRQPKGEFTVYDSTYPREEPDVSTPARAAAVVIENGVRFDEKETGTLIAADGRLILQRIGEPNRVRFPVRVLERAAGATFTHNHPGGTSFSVDDIALAAEYGFSEMRVITPLHRFSMRPINTWPNPADIEKAYNLEIEHVKLAIHHLVQAGELGGKYKGAETMHVLWARLAKAMRMKYLREVS